MNAITLSIVVVFGSTLAAILGMLVVRRCVTFDQLQAHHEVAGYLLGVVGTLYAVLLGLVIVDVQAKYQQARLMEETESSAAADLFHIVGAFPKPTGGAIRQVLYDYVLIILNDEWNSADTGTTHQTSTVPLRKIWRMLNTYEPISNHEQGSYSQALSTMCQLGDSRRFRIVSSSTNIQPALLGVLIAGAVLTVLLTYFFGVSNLKSHILMTTVLSVCLSLNVLLVVLYSNPYRGDLKVQPVGFCYDAEKFQEMMKTEGSGH